MAARADNDSVTIERADAALFRPGRGIGVFWIVAGALGWVVSFLLYREYIGQLTGADAIFTCDISPIVTCGPNLLSPGGNLLGFSNSLIGIVLFVGPVYAGVTAWASNGLRAWYWRVYTVVVAAAFAFVHVLAYRSVFEYGSLCPWCMVVWLVTIPLFWSVLGWSLRAGVWGATPVRVGIAMLSWLPLIVIGNYLLIAVAAQARLDVLGSL